MDEKPDQIMSHIESQRDQLGRNLNELESRVKDAADWRVHFDNNPMLMMGVALGGGLLLGSIVSGAKKSGSGRASWSSSSRNYSTGATPAAAAAGYGAGSYASSSPTSPALREQRRKATDTLEHMKAALIGFATAKVKEFMTEALPGFNQHLEEAEKRNTSGGYGESMHSGASYPGNEPGGKGADNRQYGAQATPRTEQSAHSPYSNQGAGQNTGLNI